MHGKVVLAYDGSINADWIGRYAVQMARGLPSRRLLLIHILDGSHPPALIDKQFAAIAVEGQRYSVNCQGLLLPLAGDVVSSLLGALPRGDETFCLCGARVASRGRGFLAGTVSEQLLRSGRCSVMAIRVVSPGLLGCPRNLLFPLAGHPRGFRSAMPFLRLLTPSLDRLHLLRVMQVNPFRFRYITTDTARRKISQGRDYLAGIAAEIRQECTGAHWHLDCHAVLSDDWAKEILIQAGKVRAAMILLGASERSLPSRLFYGNRLEQILRNAFCDVGIYRRP